MDVGQLEDAHPYLEFVGDFDENEESWYDEDDDNESILVKFANGSIAKGENAGNEYFAIECGAVLNELGKELLESVKALAEIGLVEITQGKKEFVSMAPWHARSV